MAEMTKIYPGLNVRTLFGETDTVGEVERVTPPGTWGYITGNNHADHWNVVFEGGGSVVLTASEMLDRTKYSRRPAQTLVQCALALQYGQDVLELTILDDSMIGFTQDVAGCPEQILEQQKTIDAHERGAELLRSTLKRVLTRWTPQDQEQDPQLGLDMKRTLRCGFSWETTAEEALV